MRSPSRQPKRPAGRPARLVPRLLTAALLGLACTALVACGSSGKGLIPAADAGPLQNDFETIAREAEAGNGNCVATNEAIAKTEADFAALPGSVDPGLRARLREGVENLAKRSREMCREPSAGTTATATTTTSTTTRPTTSSTSTTSTSTSTTTSTPSSSSTSPTATIPNPAAAPLLPAKAPAHPAAAMATARATEKATAARARVEPAPAMVRATALATARPTRGAASERLPTGAAAERRHHRTERPVSATEIAGRYRLESRLGFGGMSTVHRATDERLERRVAVKLLAEHLAEDPTFVSRFQREAQAAARLVHPNIVQVFDSGLDEASHQHFIVMEYIEGQSCAEILRDDGWVDVEEAASIIEQACEGLHYAHRHGVVHRDVKPGNLLRAREGEVKLADFGIAKATEQSLDHAGRLGARHGRLPGTRAGARRGGWSARGPLRAGRRRLPADRRPPAV